MVDSVLRDKLSTIDCADLVNSDQKQTLEESWFRSNAPLGPLLSKGPSLVYARVLVIIVLVSLRHVITGMAMVMLNVVVMMMMVMVSKGRHGLVGVFGK